LPTTSLLSDDVARHEALQLLCDIEGSLRPGESWTLTVSDEIGSVFRIKLDTAALRSQRVSHAKEVRRTSVRLIPRVRASSR